MFGIHQGGGIAVFLKTEKKRRKFVGISIDLFVSCDQIQKIFDQKELQIKMFYVLNVSNPNSKPQEFSLRDIEVFVDSEEQNWFRRAHVGKFLGLGNIRTSLNDLDQCKIFTRQELIPTQRSTSLWPGPKD